jgi:AcrR family transcriptional regulator
MRLYRPIVLLVKHRLDETMSTRTGPGPRERLLNAAETLTYSHGPGIGVDRILKTANVARRSLYEHFGGKDGLLLEVLKRTAAADEARYRETMDAAGDDPRDRLLAIFDRLRELIAAPGFRGCRYLAADQAMNEPAHPVHTVTRDYRAHVRGLLERELTRLGHTEPDRAAGQLHVLIDGAMAAGATSPDTDPATAARELAEGVLARSPL